MNRPSIFVDSSQAGNNKLDWFLQNIKQDLSNYRAQINMAISSDVEGYTARALTDSSLAINERGVVGVFNHLTFADANGLAIVVSCRKYDSEEVFQYLFAAKYNTDGKVNMIEKSPIELDDRIWQERIRTLDIGKIPSASPSFEKDKKILEKTLFDTIFINKAEENGEKLNITPAEKNMNKQYLLNHPQARIDANKNVFIPLPEEILNYSTQAAKQMCINAHQAAKQYIRDNHLNTYTLYSTNPIFEDHINDSQHGLANVYMFTTEYKTYDVNGRYMSGNLYMCCSNPNLVTDGNTQKFDNSNFHLSWVSKIDMYNNLRYNNNVPEDEKLSKETLLYWLDNGFAPYLSGKLEKSDLITQEQKRQIKENISRLNIAEGNFSITQESDNN